MDKEDIFNVSTSTADANKTYDTLTDFEQVAAVFIYSVISVLAVGGNVCVIYLVFKFQTLRSPANLLIANLAIADLLMAVFCIPFSYWPLLILSYWPFGYFLCKFINYSQIVTVMTSAYTLVAISLDRFVAIMFPMKTSLKLTKMKVLCYICIIWLGSAVIGCPLLYVLTITVFPDGSLQCLEDWDPKSAESWYSLMLLLIQFVIPLCVFIITYAGIGLKLWYSRVPGEGNVGVNKERKDSVKKIIPTMMIVTLVFAVSWIPINVLNIWRSLEPAVSGHWHILRIWWACHLIETMHTFVNPLVYVVRNRRFRDGFAYFYRWLPCVHYSGALHMNRQRPKFVNNYQHKKNVRLLHVSDTTGRSNAETTDKLLTVDVTDEQTLSVWKGSPRFVR